MTVPSPQRLRDVLPATGRVVLATHRYPDPDGLGAMLGMEYLLEQGFGLQADLVLDGQIRRAENAAMRRLLNIRALPRGAVDPATHAGVVLVDAQPGFSHTRLPGGLPILAVVDHHEGMEKQDPPADVPFRWVDPSYGTTSTMVHHLLKAAGVEPDRRTATALFCGIRYDTNHLARDATPRDADSYYELERLADRRVIAAIDQPPLARVYFRQMASAIRDCTVYKETVALTLMGEVQSPEIVAEVADWFLRLEKVQWSLAGGAAEGRYHLSLRTDLEGADAYAVLREVVGEEGACGGHGRMAGGQIPLEDLTLDEVRERVRSRILALFGLNPGEARPLDEGHGEPQGD